ncbi:MAG: ATP-binding protein [Chloroflexota bacterium]
MSSAAAAIAPGGLFLTRGHDSAVRLISRAIQTENPPHALLLVGPRGVGKTTLALDLAAGLMCLVDDAAMRPCRECAACRKVASENHADLHIVRPDGAGEQIRITQVQQLTSELSLTAMEGRFRIAIVSSAQRMNPDAQNALLKTLEEPGPATCLILCADDAAPLLATVLSRAARVRLAPMSIEALADLLSKDGTQPSQARSLALAAGGRPGLAMTLAQQPHALLARDRISRTLLDLLDADRRARLAAAADLIADGATLAAALRGEVPSSSKRLPPLERRRAVTTVLEVWREVGRDLAITAQGQGRSVRDLDVLEELQRAATRVDRVELLRFLDLSDRLALAIESYASPELTLDVLLLSWPRPRVRQATRSA